MPEIPNRYPEKRREKALWRRFEAASPQEREGMVTWYERGDTVDGKLMAMRRSGRILVNPAIDPTEFPTEAELESLTWTKFVKHDERWIRIRCSFCKSKEWKQFRFQWLQAHPACVRCGRTDGVLQVHHTGCYHLDHIVLGEGFLEPLKHPERFGTLCVGCVQKEHADFIEYEAILGKILFGKAPTVEEVSKKLGIPIDGLPEFLDVYHQYLREQVQHGLTIKEAEECLEAVVARA